MFELTYQTVFAVQCIVHLSFQENLDKEMIVCLLNILVKLL